jgi:hypothetical protein
MAAVLATDGALSHASALAVWRVLPKRGPIQVSVPVGRRAIRAPGLTVHRGRPWTVDRLGPFPVTPLPRSLVDTWGSAHRSGAAGRDRERARATVIDTIRDRRLKTRELRVELDVRPALPGRRALGVLLGLIDEGCQSELEIWGVRHA